MSLEGFLQGLDPEAQAAIIGGIAGERRAGSSRFSAYCWACLGSAGRGAWAECSVTNPGTSS